MPWKMNEEGTAIAMGEDNKPLWVHEDGKATPFDADHTLSTIKRLNGEAKSYREAKEAIEGKLRMYDGIEDPDAARDALGKVKNLSAGELKTAEQVAEMQRAAQKAAEEQVKAAQDAGNRKITALEKDLGLTTQRLVNEMMTNAFSRSKYASEKLAIPVDMTQAAFGNLFKIEDNRIVGYGRDGNKIYSRVRNGELADFDEALEMMVDSYPNRDAILKGSNSSGSGAQGGRGGGPNTITRSEFERLDQLQRVEALKTKKLVD